jgi:hypothetical protein
MRANKRRMVLSIYLDFILIYGTVALFLFFSGLDSDYVLVLSLVATGFVRAVLHGAAASPGMHMLGVDREYAIDAAIATRESWLTMLLGVALVWSGMEEALRWLELPFPMPYFGFVASIGIDILIALAHGLLYVAAGWLILRLSRWGLWLGLALGVADACSTILSWNVWDRLVPMWAAFWPQRQDRPMREGEIEFVQSFLQWLLPEALLAITLLVMVGLLLSRRRFVPSGA